eukprot:8880785-Karenia_brevis.AAC.1
MGHHFGFIGESVWDHLAVISESSEDHLGAFWVHLEINLGICFQSSVGHLGSPGDHFGVT